MSLDGLTYPVTATIDALLWTYNHTCRQDRETGEFCAPVFEAWGSGNASDQSCSDCVLGSYQLVLGHFLGFTEEAAEDFSSLVESCEATGYPITSPPPNYINQTSATVPTGTSTSPAPVKSCVSTYTVQVDDDCNSISLAQNVSTSNMLYFNNLQAGCADFPGPDTELCMPYTCQVYTVQQGDSCWSIVQDNEHDFSISQLVSWNLDINAGCSNLELLTGAQICISFPGVSADVTVTNPAPSATIAPIPSNIVDNTNTRCSRYYEIRGGDTCASVSQTLGISLSDLYFLNPQINSTTCHNLLAGYSYCVQAVGDIATYPGYNGRPTNPCVGSNELPEMSCYATTYETASPWSFPAVNTTSGTSEISSFSSFPITPISPYPTTPIGNPTPTPFQDDMVDGCGRFYFVVEGDGCFDIAQRWVISLSSLYDWNPNLNGDCTGLTLGTYICVGLGQSSSTSSRNEPPATTTEGGLPPPPGPTQGGTPLDCNAWIMQQEGIFCYDMASNAGISLDCLYELNPALDECRGLWAGYAYCVGTVSNQCI
ncbi:hypothetical protein S40293_08856 [Stachybotrys chartarum IBT 40293]|nr:hypothetical protein S40293_08856 [Stachybotrys chartarum IBT 40293]KFA73519.1 hypothetical protein S40288_05769 [Stachybotrys chartarum IBT 40288]